MRKLGKFTFKLILFLFLIMNVIVIFHAYKFTHFYERGTADLIAPNKKTTTDKLSEIFFGIKAEKKPNEINDTSFPSKIILTSDGLHLQSWYLSSSDTAKGTILMFHGHGSNKAAILPQAMYFNQLGYHVLLTDFRAHGASEGNTTTIGYMEAKDVVAAYDSVKAWGEKKIILYGISMGAATVAKAISDSGLTPYKVILEMPFGSIEDAVTSRIKMMHLPAQPLSTMLTFWGGTLHGFWAFNMKPTEYVKKIKCPVLLQRGAQDPRVSQVETDVIYANMNSPKKMVIYENSGHENLFAKEQEKWKENVSLFLAQ